MAGGAMPGRARTGRRRRLAVQPMAEINVTPFVDVMLVLLIIFMVAAPLMTVGVPLELPETEAEALPTPKEEPLTVNLDASGAIYIQDTAVAPEELIPRLSAMRDTRETGKIYLRADRVLDYGRVMQVMGALNRAGFRDIGLVTDQADPARQGG